MAYLKTRRHPAAAAHGYEWPDGDTVVEVADEHATALLRIQGGQFYEVLPSDPEHPDYQPPTADADPDAGLDDAADEDSDSDPADEAENAADTPSEQTGTHRRRERAPRAPAAP